MSTPPTDVEPDEGSESALTDEELKAAAPEVLATNLGEYLGAWWRRIKGGESGKATVPAPGKYDFLCTIHPGMKGTIIVT